MNAPVKITAILGTYRKGGVIDSAVEEILAAAREAGAETAKIYLIDRHIEFCTNCRTCTQQEGEQPRRVPAGRRHGRPARRNRTLRRHRAGLADELLDGHGRDEAVHRAAGLLRLLALGNAWPRRCGTAEDEAGRGGRFFGGPVVVGPADDADGRPAEELRRLLGAKNVDVLFIGLAAGEPKADIGARPKEGPAAGEETGFTKCLSGMISPKRGRVV